MKIIQVTPGVIPIPPNGWGAVEKIIWEYKLCLDKVGYPTEIKYCDDIENSDKQIVHVHMANLANILHSRGIDYVFSLHDHHVEHFGKESDCYKENYKAIKNSKLTFVHSKHLIEYFDNLPQIIYLPHGANLDDYKLLDRSGRLLKKRPNLLMMANNGVGGNKHADRKGFLVGIEAAKKLDLDITIVCPNSNKYFFDYHNVKYDKLTIIYDLDYKDSISLLKKFDIFLHPSNLEAGHPNLTITESLSSGIPVVGVVNTKVPGTISVERGVDEFVSGIQLAIEKYDSLIGEIIENRYQFSWDIIASRMLENYKKFYNITQRSQLLNAYNSVTIKHKNKLERLPIISSFNSHKYFIKTSIFSPGCLVLFKDNRTNTLIFQCEIGKSPGNWAYIHSDRKSFIDVSIEVKQGVNVIYSNRLNLKNQRVILEVSEYFVGLENLIDNFVQQTGCYLTVKSTNKIRNYQYDSNPNHEEFYFSLTSDQLKDFFLSKSRKSDSHLVILSSSALGDNIGFLPYAEKWAESNRIYPDVALRHHKLFDCDNYKNINLISDQNIDISKYTDISRFEYDFHKPLQEGYSDQFGLEYEEIRPFIKVENTTTPIKNKYVVLGVHTTAQCKYWNYPDGWEILSKQLRKLGYTPVALDLHEVFGIEGHWNYLPDSSVKKVGLSFEEVIRYLTHCEFFIGVSSGLSWLAWAIGKKVIMISGVTEEKNEFQSNNYKVLNKSVCNSCFNTKKYIFDTGDWLWCPVNRDTDKWFECSKTISPEMVLEKVRMIESEIYQNI